MALPPCFSRGPSTGSPSTSPRRPPSPRWQRAPAVPWHPGLKGTARKAGLLHSHRKAPQLSGAGLGLCPLVQRMPHLTPEVLKRPHQKGPDTQTWLVQLSAAPKEGHDCPESQTRLLHSARTSPPLMKLPISAAQNPLESQNSRLCPFSQPKEPSGGAGQLLKPCPQREGTLPRFHPLGKASLPQVS